MVPPARKSEPRTAAITAGWSKDLFTPRIGEASLPMSAVTIGQPGGSGNGTFPVNSRGKLGTPLRGHWRDYRQRREPERHDRSGHLDGSRAADGRRSGPRPRLLPRRDRAHRDRAVERHPPHGQRRSIGAGRRRARRRPGGPAAPPRDERALPPGDPRPDPRRPRPRPATSRRGRLAAQRRLRPSGQRGPLSERPGGQRNRALPRPATRRVAVPRRRPPDGHAAPRPRRRARRAPPRGRQRPDAPGHPDRPRPPQRRST